MFAEERQEHIIKDLLLQKRVTVSELSEKYHASIHTIRRDLSILEEKGLIQRTHGGAILIEKTRIRPLDPNTRYNSDEVYHHNVAKAAVTFIKPGDTVFISGSVVHKVMLEYLPADQSITIVTNSIEIAYQLRGKDGIDTYLTGGLLPISGNFVDSLSTEYINQFNFDLCFVVGRSIDAERGITTSNPEVALFHRKVLERSTKKICLANHYKFIKPSFAEVCPIDKLDLIIVDSFVPQNEIEKIKDKGVEVLIT